MKRLAFLILLISLIATPVFASNLEVFDEVDLGVKLDAPSLFLKTTHVDLGLEAGTYDISKFVNEQEDDWDAYIVGKVTVKWSLVDLTK